MYTPNNVKGFIHLLDSKNEALLFMTQEQALRYQLQPSMHLKAILSDPLDESQEFFFYQNVDDPNITILSSLLLSYGGLSFNVY